MGKQKKPLTASQVFARIRPTDASGKSGHTADGEAGNKTIGSFTRDSVTIQDTGTRSDEKFELTKVVLPDEDQEACFNTSIVESGLLQGFHDNTNILFFAYGQTGSGKTHSMLGVTASLSNPTPDDGWGLFPRVVYATIEKIAAWKAEGTHAILTVAAVEFYCNGAFDLDFHKEPGAKKLPPKSLVTITSDAQALGAKETTLTSAGDLAEYLPRVFGNRYVAATKMNDASSRSHCALILSLYKLDASNMYMKTTFSLIDLAGSERNDKTGGERVDGNKAVIECMKMFNDGTPEKLSLGVQGFMINYELSLVQTAILGAGECHRKGLPYKATKSLSTAGVIYMTACCDGRARLGMVVTLSPSPQHGFESWFTLKYTEALAKLKTPLVYQKAVEMDKAVEAAGKAAIAAQKDFEKLAEPEGAKKFMMYMAKQGVMEAAASTHKILKELASSKAAAPPSASQASTTKRSGWGGVRKHAQEQSKVNKLSRIAAKWNTRFEVSKVPNLFKGITNAVTTSVGKATAMVGPQPKVVLNGQFADPSVNGSA